MYLNRKFKSDFLHILKTRFWRLFYPAKEAIISCLYHLTLPPPQLCCSFKEGFSSFYSFMKANSPLTRGYKYIAVFQEKAQMESNVFYETRKMMNISWLKLDIKATCMCLTWKQQRSHKGTDPFFALILTPWKKSESYGYTGNTRTRPAVLQFQTAMTQLPALEGESEQKHLGVIFLKSGRNDYKFIANLWGEWDVYGSRSDLIRWIRRNFNAPSASEKAANTLSACCQEALNTTCVCIHLVPLQHKNIVLG